MWIKSHSAALQRFSIPAPVIGGLPFALVFSLLKIYGIADFTFDDTLQKVALAAKSSAAVLFYHYRHDGELKTC